MTKAVVDFLYARLTEEREAAMQAKPSFLGWLGTLGRVPGFSVHGAHVMHWQPSRVLDEIDAKYDRIDFILANRELSQDARDRLLMMEAHPYRNHPHHPARQVPSY